MQLCPLWSFSSSHSTWKSAKARRGWRREAQTHLEHDVAPQVAGRLNGTSSLGLPLLWGSPSTAHPSKEANSSDESRASGRREEQLGFFPCIWRVSPQNLLPFFLLWAASRTGGNGNVLEFYFFQTESYKGYLLALPHGLKYKYQCLGRKSQSGKRLQRTDVIKQNKNLKTFK